MGKSLHPPVMVEETAAAVFILVDNGLCLCDGCCKDCSNEPHGFMFGPFVVCADCATDAIRNGLEPDEVSRPDETFKTYCDRMNAPLRAKMDSLVARTN